MFSRLARSGRFAAIVCAAALAACTGLPSADPAARARPDFGGVWEMLDMKEVIRPELANPPYTARAQKVVDEFRSWDPKKDDPALYCDLKGMPWMMLSRARTYPTEIHQTPDRIHLFFEFLDTSRTIRITDAPPPADLTPSINGYSTARWEGDTLVITTRALAERLYPSPQLRSEKALITERWQLQKDPAQGDLIKVDFTIDDPEVYTRPVIGRQVFKRAPAGTLVASYNCTEKLWLKHVDDKRASLKAAQAPK